MKSFLKAITVIYLFAAVNCFSQTVISNVYVQSSTATTATIVWTTSTPSTSQIKYGTNSTIPYANNVNYSLVTSHSMTLTVLNALQPYYFATVSVDGSGHITQSSTYQFALCGQSQVPVSGTINQFYYSGTFSIIWNPPSGSSGTPTVCGSPVTTTVTGNLNLSGSLSTQVADALKVTPGPGTWTVTVEDIGDISPISVTLPLSSMTQDISSQLQTAAAGTSLVGVLANNNAETVYPPWLATAITPHGCLGANLISNGCTGATIASSALSNLGGEPSLGNPLSNGYVLSSTTAGVRSWVAAGTGSVSNFSSGNLSPLFTASVANSTTTPALTFSLSNVLQNTVYAGPASGGSGPPSFQTAPTISAANMTNFPYTGTVTSLSVVTANGISGTVATATTTPAITLSLGAITPTSTNGVSAATMAFMDATSSVQTQLNGKQATLGYTPAHSGANSDITSLTGLTSALSDSFGFIGPLTGNVTGNVSGNAGGFTGSLLGDVTGIQGATLLSKIQGVAIPSLTTGYLYYSGGSLIWNSSPAAGVTNINGTAGAFSFTGDTVNCSLNSCIFNSPYTGTVTSVGMTVPSWLTVGGSPVTGAGTLAITGTSETANQFLASPNGTAGAMTPRAIIPADLPTIQIGGGGTGATTAPAALTNLGAAALAGGNTLTGYQNIGSDWSPYWSTLNAPIENGYTPSNLWGNYGNFLIADDNANVSYGFDIQNESNGSNASTFISLTNQNATKTLSFYQNGAGYIEAYNPQYNEIGNMPHTIYAPNIAGIWADGGAPLVLGACCSAGIGMHFYHSQDESVDILMDSTGVRLQNSSPTIAPAVTLTQAIMQTNQVFSAPTSITSITGTAPNMTINGTFPSGGANGYLNWGFAIMNATNTANDGFFICTGSTTTTITYSNPSAVAETFPGIAVTSFTGTAPGVLNFTNSGTNGLSVGSEVQFSGFNGGAASLNISAAAFFGTSGSGGKVLASPAPTATTFSVNVQGATTTGSSAGAANAALLWFPAATSYAGTFAGGANNALAYAQNVAVSGFTNSGNNFNGTTQQHEIYASSTTGVATTNVNGVNETYAGSMISAAPNSSPPWYYQATYANGSGISSLDDWEVQNVIGGLTANPTSTLTFTHTGTSGTSSVSIPYPVTEQTQTLTAAAPTVTGGQIGLGGTTAAASNCNQSGTLTGVAGCLVINVAGTTHYVPYF